MTRIQGLFKSSAASAEQSSRDRHLASEPGNPLDLREAIYRAAVTQLVDEIEGRRAEALVGRPLQDAA